MKRETQIRIFCALLLILGAIYYFYAKPESFVFFLLIAVSMLLTSLISPKTIHVPDYSKYVSIVGVLFAILSYAIFFVYPYLMEIWQYKWSEIIVSAVFFIYFVFLIWYKKNW